MKKIILTLSFLSIITSFVLGIPTYTRGEELSEVCNDFIGNYEEGEFALGAKEYLNGYLVQHFKLNSVSNGRSINFFTGLYKENNNNCEFLAEISQLITLPPEVTDFSIRFVSDKKFVLYNDNTDTELLLPDLAAEFTASEEPPFKVEIYMNFDSHNEAGELYITPTDIKKSNNSPAKTPMLIVPGIGGTELFYNNQISWTDLFRMAQTNDGFLLNELAMDSEGHSKV
jgi:hypothetical protein